MQLDSYEFITLLLPLTLLAYFTVGRVHIVLQKVVLCAAGVVLYAYSGLKNLLIFLIVLVFNYLMLQCMLEAKWLRKPMIFLTLAFDVLVLFVFKYSNFAISSVNALLGKGISLLNLSVPIGVSFFSIQLIAYAVNVYNGKIQELRPLDYLTYIFYFPKLIMGPIADPEDLISQLNDHSLTKWNWENFVSGIRLFGFGLFKKVVLADTFALAVSWGSENAGTTTWLDTIIIMLSYTFEIYFGFSGYSDMAIGVSDMMNIHLPVNFDSPYKALSVRDFCARWHKSLTGFFTKYVYIPLGGNRKGMVRTCLNVLIVFIFSGIWHGANWTFIIWGVLYGLLCVADRVIEPLWKKLWKPIQWFFTFAVINVLWSLFNADSVTGWIGQLKKLIPDGSFTVSEGLSACFRGVEMNLFEGFLHLNNISAVTSGLVWLILFIAAGFGICMVPKNNCRMEKDYRMVYVVLSAVAFAWSFLFLGNESTFIYSNF